MEPNMRDIVSDILTWPWFSEPHGYNFNGHLVRDPGGNICIDPVEPTETDMDGVHELDLAVPAEPFDEGCALGMAHRNADVGPLGGQELHNLATKESRSSEYGYPFGCHWFSLLKTGHNPKLPIFVSPTGYARILNG